MNFPMKKTTTQLMIAMLFSALLAGCSTAPKASEQAQFLDKAKSTTKWFEGKVTGLPRQLDQTAGFVIFPDVVQWGILISGGKFGRGAVCKADGTQIGWAAVNVGSVGLQAGVQGFKMLLVMQDQATVDKFMKNQLTGTASGVLVAVETGASASNNFQNGVVLYEGANKGLMAGVNVGLNYMRYEPFKADEKPGDLR